MPRWTPAACSAKRSSAGRLKRPGGSRIHRRCGPQTREDIERALRGEVVRHDLDVRMWALSADAVGRAPPQAVTG